MTELTRNFRRARVADLPRILELIECGRQKMRAAGNNEQWTNGQPSQEVIEEDIRLGESYVMTENGKVVVTFAFKPGPDVTYAKIYEGKWLDDVKPYYVVHRLASAPGVRGVLKDVLNFCFSHTDNIRIDTHRQNVVMRHALEKYGFRYCGIIYLLDGAERLAFQSCNSVAITEQSSNYDNLEQMSVVELLHHINEEDYRVAEAVKLAIPQIQAFVEAVEERMKLGGRLFYIGAGTSGRLGVLDASELPPTFGVSDTKVVGLIAGGDRALRHAVEKAEDMPEQGWQDLQAYHPTANDTVLGIAASGTTPYVVGVVRLARLNGLLTGCITSNPHTPLAQTSDFPIETIVGPEFVTGSSRMKSGTAQKMVLNMISTTLMVRMGRVQGNRMVNMQLTNAKLVDRGTRMVQDMLGLSYEEAQQRLLEAGSVDEACHY
jgi:N-acetylmuramic acid 6-phosphate etherase